MIPSRGCSLVFALTGLVMSTAVAAEWPGGDPVEIQAEAHVTNAVERGTVAQLVVNGSLTFLAGSGLTLTGNVVSAVGSGEGADAAFDLLGGSVTNLGSGHFAVGYCGGTGSMAVASGAAFRTHTGWFDIARNEEGMRGLASYGEVTVAGMLVATNRLQFTGFFPNAPELSPPPYVVSARLTLEAGGEVEVGEIYKNDCAASEFVFRGGTLRAMRDHANFIQGGGVMDMVVADGRDAVFDTAGCNVAIVPRSVPQDLFLTLRGNGGLVKRGAGRLTFRLSSACNTFSGAIAVEEGTLELGRPLAAGQTVTVHAGAQFVPYDAGDVGKITYQGGGVGGMTYVVAVDTAGLDLTAINDRFFDDRLAGPFSGMPTVTLSNMVTHSAGDAVGSPFRLIGQGGTLNLTNTGLEAAFLLVEGPGTFTFPGSRVYTSADAGRLAVTDGGFRQNGDFTLGDVSESTPASLALPGGRFDVGGMLKVGMGGYGQFAVNGAAIVSETLRIGGGVGNWGTFAQSSGTVTVNGETVVGADGGFGTLSVTGGLFADKTSLRIASNPGVVRDLQPDGVVTVSNAVLQCLDLYFTSWWTTDNIAARSVEAGLLNLLPDGVAEVRSLFKNDDPISAVRFAGGKVRARESHPHFLNVTQSGTLRLMAEEGHFITLDTQGHAVAATNHSGTLAFSGAGGFKKQGAGTLHYGPDRADYAGDTVIEAGTLRMTLAGRIPNGPGAGDLRFGVGGTLDLNGNHETVNRVLGAGRVVSANAPATFGVLADGSSDTWGRARFDGQVAVEKLGGGTLTLCTMQAVPGNLAIYGGTVQTAPAVGYPYYRFKIESVKNPGTANSMQLSEIALYDDGVDVTPARIGIAYDSTGGAGSTAASNAFPDGERPEMAVDGIVMPGTEKNKWLDFRMGTGRSLADRERVWLRIEFPSAQRITHYNWATGNDNPERDPADWRLQGSFDGETWVDLDKRTNYVATGTRNAWVEPGRFPVSSAVAQINAIGDGSVVFVRDDASLALSMPETIGGLVGGGMVSLADADLTLAVAGDTSEVFFGTVTGSGALVKDGPGTQVMSGTNTYSGPTVVRNGVLLIQGMSPHRWFRFTVKKTKGASAVMQFSELALYGSDGQRWNTNLVKGVDTATLEPGQWAEPPGYAYTGTGETTERPDKLFDNNTGTKWCLINNTMSPDSSNTWRTVVMRLPDAAPEITAYNLCTANDDPPRDPATWTLEGSLDGSTWELLDARFDVAPPSTGGGVTSGTFANTGRFLYYNDGIPYGLADRAMSTAAETEGASDVIPAGSTVEVYAGASLDVRMAEGIGALRVDMLNAGTITRLIPESNGTLHIVNAGGQTGALMLPLTVGSVADRAALGTWAVYIDGVLQNGAVLAVDAEGRLYLRSKGTILLLL